MAEYLSQGFSTTRRLPVRLGFTLVELLVVVAILATLFALLLPAIQTARESARRAQCQNNLRQIALALLTYHDTYNMFPHGGWGHQWVGVPERGVGAKQPGGWIYGVLPFVEESDLYHLGHNRAGALATNLYSQRLQTPIRLFVCPTRRDCVAWPVSDRYAYVKTPRPFGNVTVVARADYAINGGSSHVFSLGGPIDLQQGDDEKYWRNAPSVRKFSGISHLHTAASIRNIADGTSNTYLIGEKYVDEPNYMTGLSIGDNESLYAGYCTDLHRFAGAVERVALSLMPYAEPLNDNAFVSDGIAPASRFGSAHSSGLNFVNCDGASHFVSYDVDPDVHFRRGHRRDDGGTLNSLFGRD